MKAQDQTTSVLFQSLANELLQSQTLPQTLAGPRPRRASVTSDKLKFVDNSQSTIVHFRYCVHRMWALHVAIMQKAMAKSYPDERFRQSRTLQEQRAMAKDQN